MTDLVTTLKQKLGNQVRRRDIIRVANNLKCDYSWLLRRRDIICGRGTFDLTKLDNTATVNTQPEPVLTQEQIEEKINARFDALKLMSKAAAEGKTKAVIISGPPGLGKTFEVIKAIKSAQPNFDDATNKISGFVRPTGLYKSLFEHSAPGKILLFDDADSIFTDDASLNLLKAACDTTDKRIISWRAETHMKDELGEALPNWFEFHGTVVFVTNCDFNAAIERGSRLAPHFEAFVDRAHYLDLELKSKQDYLFRIRQVMQECLANNNIKLLGLSQPADAGEIYAYMRDEIKDLKKISLRTVIRLGQIKHIGGDWKRLANTLN